MPRQWEMGCNGAPQDTGTGLCHGLKAHCDPFLGCLGSCLRITHIKARLPAIPHFRAPGDLSKQAVCCFGDRETEAQHGNGTNLHQDSGTSCRVAQCRGWVESVPEDVKLDSQTPRSFALLLFCFPPVFFPFISSNGSFTESEIPRAMSS